MISHHRDIKTFLDEYGATNISIDAGGKHPRFVFEYQGRKLSCPVSKTPSDPNATLQAIRELRDMMGPRTEEPRREPRSLEDMLPPAPEQPRYMGAMAMYDTGPGNHRIRFILPVDLAISLKLEGQIVDVARLDKETWRLKPCGSEKRKAPHVKREHQQYHIDCGMPEIVSGYGKFGATPAEYIVVGDDLIAHLNSADIRPLAERKSNPWLERLQNPPPPKETPPMPMPLPPYDPSYNSSLLAPLPVEPPVMTPPPVLPPGGEIIAVDDYLKSILRTVVRAEKVTGRRLTRMRRDNGDSYWVWRAADIQLDEADEG